MGIDHSRAPVLEAMRKHKAEGLLSFLPPGHKQGRGVDPRVLAVMGEDVFASDIIMMNGLDDRVMSGGVLSEAEELMADAVDADHAFFSTCGSSLSVKTCVITVAGPGQRMLVSRNAHKSVIAALILAGVEPVWVHPRWDERWQLAHPPGPQDVAAAADRAPDAAGMLLVTPTDYGTCAGIAEIADLCHERGMPLVVDEAWGAHLPFHPGLPSWAMDAGADLCVTSVHKMGCGLEQSSVYHLRGDRVDKDVLTARADLLDTTSPSCLVYAALDGWRRQMAEHGERLLDSAIGLAAGVRARLAGIGGVRVMDRDDLVGPDRADDLDPLKIVIDLDELGISGYAANGWLREHQLVEVGLSDHRRIAAQITVADTRATGDRLVEAVAALVEHRADLPPAKRVDLPAPGELELEQAVPPRRRSSAAPSTCPPPRPSAGSPPRRSAPTRPACPRSPPAR
ncbi:aminotransferase class I/II-fold pyridoxal phosphate-dependent enzyme [Actinokineospora soli]|uniref:Aminotransferase class I/II-fold pyridoxal phosphate-dependent enzyme n=1 Tax=Actinokineospora soli TaxID=1048753 RepID=A0ABW2TPG9_9PSEU